MPKKRAAPTTFYLSSELRDQLRGLCARAGTPASAILRRALGEYLARAERHELILADPQALADMTQAERLVLLYRLGGSVSPGLERAIIAREGRGS